MSAAGVLALLELLQAHPGLTGPELAARLEIDVRTVRRHLVTLSGLGVPVVGERGRYGGYRLLPGYKLPPLMLTGDEAVAVVLGLLAEERVRPGPAASAARAKIERVLPAELRERVAALVETVGFSTAAPRTEAVPRTDLLLTLAEAIRRQRRVRLAYTARDGTASERGLDPFGLVCHAGRWYLTGHDHLRDAVRTFRLDRIGAVEPLGPAASPPAGFDPVETVLAGIGAAPWRHAVEVVLHAPLPEVRARLPRTVGTLTTHPAGTLLRARAERLDGMARMLAGLAWRFTVHRPGELRAAVRELAAQLLADADRPEPPAD